MLQAFTWQQFLIAALILTLVWYTGVLLFYYRKKAMDLPTGEKQQPEKLKRDWEEEFDDPDEEENLLGMVKDPDGVSSSGMDMVRFAPRVAKVEDSEEYRDTQLGILPDVLEELKSIFRILENEQGTKEDFISLFILVSSKYPQIQGSNHQQTLNEFIRENALFPISDDELNQFWQ